MRLGILDHGHRARARLFLRLIRWVTRHPVGSPAQLTAADVDAVRAAGVPDEAIVDALHVSFIFNCINRLANAFGFGWESDHQVRLGAKVIHRTSYRLPRILMR